MNTMTLGRPVRIQRLGAPLPWRPVTPAMMTPRRRLGQEDAPPGSIFDNRFVRLISSGGAAAVGIYTGVKADGVWSTAGWVIGIVSGLAAMNELFTMRKP